MIRILHLTTDSKISGAEKLLIGIASEYDKSQFELFFCTLKAKGDLHRELEELSQKVYSLDCDNIICLPGSIRKLIHILKEQEIDILHTHLFHAGILGYFATIFYRGAVMVTTRHYSNLLYLYGNNFERLMERMVLRRAKHIIAISKGVKKIVSELDGADDKKISVIYNGIDLNQPGSSADMRVQIRHEFGITDDIKLIGAIGSLHPRKGHEYLIQAAGLLCRERSDVRFIIIGDGVLKEKLVALSSSLGVREKIIFAGYRKDIPSLLAAIDIIVHPSIEEGFGISLLESMFFSKAVVATNVGGIPEIIEDRVTGLLVPAKEPVAIADAINYLLCNPEKMQKIMIAAKSRVYEEFNISVMVKNYERLYKELILNDKTNLSYA